MDWPHGEPVVIHHPGAVTEGEYGEPVYGPPTDETVEKAAVAPRTSNRSDVENNRYQTTVTSGLEVFLPSGTVVETNATMTVRGVTYEVDGEPGDWRNPFTGWHPGVVVSLKRSQ